MLFFHTDGDGGDRTLDLDTASVALIPTELRPRDGPRRTRTGIAWVQAKHSPFEIAARLIVIESTWRDLRSKTLKSRRAVRPDPAKRGTDGVKRSTWRDLNPRPRPWQNRALDQLSYTYEWLW